MILSPFYEVGKYIVDEAFSVVRSDFILVFESSSHNYDISVTDGACVTCGRVQWKSIRGVNGGDIFCRFGSKVSSHQNYVTARSLPSRVGHSGRFEVFGIGLPTLSILCELQTVVRGPGEDSAADDVTGLSVPDSGR